MKNLFNKLITLEMANNHMGDVDHALLMIKEFKKITKRYEDKFNFAWKFQFRNIETFIHESYKGKNDIKYVKRFSETKLTNNDITKIKTFAEENEFITMATAFDEESVDLIEKLNFDIIKIASCSATDWPLLNKIAETKMPIIFSTAGVKLHDIDNIVSFFQHRKKTFALMHCIGEYPTLSSNMQLNQIDLFKNRYKDIVIGYSTHEGPKDISAPIALAKGAEIFEKHIAVKTDNYKPNAYSITPIDFEIWLKSISDALAMCGIKNKRHAFSMKELSDLKKFKRGIFAKNDIHVGDSISRKEVYYAWPNCKNQILANDMSKYNKYIATKEIKANAPVYYNMVSFENTRDKVWDIVQDVKNFLNRTNVVFPNKADLEISHHYGIDNFYQIGITMITVVNKEYCKKLIIALPGQHHPEQFHKKKEETFVILHGDVNLYLNDKLLKLTIGDVVTVSPEVRHSFETINGCVIEEISSTHYTDDSYYIDEKISKNKDRKTLITHWMED